VTRSILIAIVFIIALSIPLGFKTLSSVKMSKLEEKLERLIHEAEGKDRFRAENLIIQKREGAYVISATMYIYKDLHQGYLKRIVQHLAQEIGAPVKISATVVRARLAETSSGDQEKTSH
jgi:hypothetical protein